MKRVAIKAFTLIFCISFCVAQNIRQAHQQQQQREAQQRQTTQQQDQRGTQQQAAQQQIIEQNWSVNNTATWGEAVNGIRNGGNNKSHTITISDNISIPISSEVTFGNTTDITVIVEGSGYTISRLGGASGDLLRIGARQTVVIRELTLQGGDIITIGIFRMEGRTTMSGNRVSVNGGTFTMQDNARMMGNEGGVRVLGNFIMRDNASITSNNGVGVSVSGGTFIMQDNASITNNRGDRGGVFVTGKGTFTMRGGTISGNTSGGNGGGVYIYDGNFIMENGTISGNISRNADPLWTPAGRVSVSAGGGGVSVREGTFTMKGGIISGNRAVGQISIGGGVLVEGGFWRTANFIMYGGTISKNTSGYWGGGVGANGNFIMHGGTISDNTTGDAGGGVFGGFAMNGGTISGNTTNGNGGGISVGSGTFTMQNGAILGNKAGQNGGGVFGRITKTGGIIYGNDTDPPNLRNTAGSNRGHAIVGGDTWRNATAGQEMNTGSFGFWLNETE